MRRVSKILMVLGLILAASWVWAQPVLVQRGATMDYDCTTGCTTGTSAWFDVDGANAVEVRVTLTSGTMTWNLQKTLDGGGTVYQTNTGSATATVSDARGVGWYRMNISACTNCVYDIDFRKANLRVSQ